MKITSFSNIIFVESKENNHRLKKKIFENKENFLSQPLKFLVLTAAQVKIRVKHFRFSHSQKKIV